MTQLSAAELQEMVAALKQKSAAGFSMLYDNYSAAVYGVVCRVIKNQGAAEDVMQEVFVKVWNNIEHYDAGKGAFFTWLMSITRNTAIDYMRSRQFKQSLKIQTLANDEYGNGDGGTVEINTEQHAIYSNIARLDHKYRTIIDLVYIKGYTHEEAAGILALPLGTLKTRARTALQILKKQITA
jgi:RNA polymerase sigma-70 factor (ECF subfamily)